MPYEKIYTNKFLHSNKYSINQNLSNYLLIYNSNNSPIDVYIAHPRNKK